MARANTSQAGSPKAGTALGAPGRALRTTNLRVQLAESLRERLNQGEWHEGDQLPTEAELSAEYGVSRSTVRSALQQLETLGLTITRHGMGTIVAPYGDRKSTRLNSSHVSISYGVFCLIKKTSTVNS